jgi:hypothetical protein
VSALLAAWRDCLAGYRRETGRTALDLALELAVGVLVCSALIACAALWLAAAP